MPSVMTQPCIESQLSFQTSYYKDCELTINVFLENQYIMGKSKRKCLETTISKSANCFQKLVHNFTFLMQLTFQWIFFLVFISTCSKRNFILHQNANINCCVCKIIVDKLSITRCETTLTNI